MQNAMPKLRGRTGRDKRPFPDGKSGKESREGKTGFTQVRTEAEPSLAASNVRLFRH